MKKYIIGIDGMRCPMCEQHVEEAVKKKLPLHKAKANHRKNVLTVYSEADLSEADFKAALDPTGYRTLSFKVETATKTIFGYR